MSAPAERQADRALAWETNRNGQADALARALSLTDEAAAALPPALDEARANLRRVARSLRNHLRNELARENPYAGELHVGHRDGWAVRYVEPGEDPQIPDGGWVGVLSDGTETIDFGKRSEAEAATAFTQRAINARAPAPGQSGV